MVATSQVHASAQAPTAESTSKMSSAKMLAVAARTALIGLCGLMLVCALHPDVRSGVRTAMMGDYRQVVSTAQGHLAGDARLFTVAKVKTRDSLSLEIFEIVGSGQQKLVEKIVLADARDGFFDFNGQATNLAIDDINGDGRPEILAPTFDSNLVGRLNVYNYDPESKAFTKVIR